jgi:hypothetical protein
MSPQNVTAMSLPENVIPMPAEQRAQIKQLAEAATPGPWINKQEWLPAIVVTPDPRPSFSDDVLYLADCRAFSSILPGEANAAYIAAVSPDVTLATLAYVEALETALLAAQARLDRFDGIIRHNAMMLPDLSHAQVADRVRMLNRNDLDHEVVCVLGRNRIIRLADELADAEPWALFFRDGKTIGEIADQLGVGPAQLVVRSIGRVVREIASGETEQRLVMPTKKPQCFHPEDEGGCQFCSKPIHTHG